MKKLLFIFLLFTSFLGNSQIVNIPDAFFKTELLNASTTYQVARDGSYNWMIIDVNNDGEIQESEAQNVRYLYLNDRMITSFVGLGKFLNLLYLDVSANQVSTLDVSANTSIEILRIIDMGLNTIDLSSNTVIKELFCANNNLTSIDLSANLQLEKLYCNNNNLGSLNTSNLNNLTNLDCSNNGLTNINVTTNTALTSFNCGHNTLNSLNVTTLTNLITLNFEANNLSNIDLSNNTELRYLFCNSNVLSDLQLNSNLFLINLDCANNDLTNLDLSTNSFFNQLKCQDNSALNYINLKNGNNDNFVFGTFSNFNPVGANLVVCVDELNSSLTNFIDNQIVGSVTFSEYCSFSPAQFNLIEGQVNFDISDNGCSEDAIHIPNLLVNTSNSVTNFGTFTQTDGTYKIYTDLGNFETSVLNSIPSYNMVSPNNQNNSFIDFGNQFEADFCVSSNQFQNDVSINIVPLNSARPGLLAKYKIIYENIGNTVINGDIQLSFNDVKLSFANANPSEQTVLSNTISFTYSNLNPFESRSVYIDFNVASPPITNIDDELHFNVQINPLSGDYVPSNNIYQFVQRVVDSYDPNDIHILEGSQLSINHKDNYLHYLVRFQNTGSTDALNIVVKNVLNNNLDWSTLHLQDVSHACRVAITNGNKIEFIFEDINLPSVTQNELLSNGYIVYKIKPKSNIQVNQIIPNQAEIFFDLNSGVQTNVANIKYVNTLSVDDDIKSIFTVYPVPAKDFIQINSSHTISKVELINELGQVVISIENTKSIDVSHLKSGIYYCLVTDRNGLTSVCRVVKE